MIIQRQLFVLVRYYILNTANFLPRSNVKSAYRALKLETHHLLSGLPNELL